MFRATNKNLGFEVVGKSNPGLRSKMLVHYSQPKGFVGRTLCMSVNYDGVCYGFIVAGSSPAHLPGRDPRVPLINIVNNIFYHIEKADGKYPERNFASLVLSEWELIITQLWRNKYRDKVFLFESLVELPRSGECYRRAGWTEVGVTKGFTCKRTGGQGTDSWTGRRVWDTDNLRPKRVFSKSVT